MELEDLKNAWSKYDQKLSKNLNLNEELLRTINYDKYNFAVKKPMKLELLNISIQLFMIIFLIPNIIRLSNESLYLIAGIISILLCAISLLFSVAKAKRFNKISYYHLSVTELQKDLAMLRILIIRLRKIEYALSALIGITLFPLLIKIIGNINILDNYYFLIFGISCTIGLGFAIGSWLNLFIYDKGLKDAENFLKLIDKFENED